jgi:hypothetical protein
MILDSVFRPFVEQRPVCVLARGILERLLDPDRLDRLFEATAQRQYTRDLLFSSLVELMAQVVLGVQPSVHAAWQALEERLGVTDQAVYDKLRGVELGVSAALVSDSATRAAAVIAALKAQRSPWLRGYRVRILDGNHLAATEHRLAELRTTWAAPLPGKVLAVLDPALMTVTDVFLAEDGQAQERSLLGAVPALVCAGDLWLADRNFCTTDFLAAIAARQGCFAIRQHGSLRGQLVGQRQSRGRCPTGRVYEQALHVRTEQGEVLRLRRVTVLLDRPTRDGDTAIHILTNLPAQVPAARVAELYRQRWTIEGLFLQAAQTLDCEIDTLCYPKAALFAFCLGLLACNAVALLQAALRAAHGREQAQGLSAYYLTLEVRQTYDGMMVAVPAAHWAVFGRLTDTEVAEVFRDLATRVTLRRYRKHPRRPKKDPPKRRRYQNGEHVATAKILAARDNSK